MARLGKLPTRWSPQISLVVLALLIAWLYLPVLQGSFVNWDDDGNFLRNYYFRGLTWDSLAWAWTTVHYGVYQPLAWLAFETQYCAFGLQPMGYHAVSLGLVVANFIALASLLQLLLRASSRASVWGPSLAAAGLFWVHPLRVEVVAWVSAQPYLFCAFFYMLTLILYVRANAVPTRRTGMAAALVTYACALGFKAEAVSLPMALILIDAVSLHRRPRPSGPALASWLRRLVAGKLPFFIIAGLAAAAAVVGKRQVGSIVDMQQYGGGARLLLGAQRLMTPLAQTLWPTRLSIYHPLPAHFDPHDMLLWLAVVSSVGISICLWRWRRQYPQLLAVWFMYITAMLPHVGYPQVGFMIMADRYSLLPGLALAALLAGSLEARWQRWYPGIITMVIVVAGGLAYLSSQQIATWQSSVSLMQQAAAQISPGRDGDSEAASIIYYNLGVALSQSKQRPAAIAALEAALEAQPYYMDARRALSLELAANGQLTKAILGWQDLVQRSLAITQNGGSPKLGPADLENRLGMTLADVNAPEAAMAAFRRALIHNPAHVDAHANLGFLLLQAGQVDAAMTSLDRALALNPEQPFALNSRAVALVAQNRLGEALKACEAALVNNSDFIDALINKGHILARLGDDSGAIASFKKALRQGGGHPEVSASLGWALLRMGRVVEAQASFRAALDLRPDLQTAKDGLAACRMY